MTLGYLVLSVAVLILRRNEIPWALGRIVSDALSPEAGFGGLGGFLLSRGVRFGTMRGLISNEAGCGTAPTAHATAEGVSPARQGVMGILEVFFDTVVLCTVTALVILLGEGVPYADGRSFLAVTLNAYEAVLGSWASSFMALAVLLFGLATVICWAHYGCESTRFLSEKPFARRCFGIVYLLSVLLGAVVTSDGVWQITDLAVGAMTLINLIAILSMNRSVRDETLLEFDPPRKEP
jgi:AGCS family alanine or glycine:cation symporter